MTACSSTVSLKGGLGKLMSVMNSVVVPVAVGKNIVAADIDL